MGGIVPKIFDNIGNIGHLRCPIILIHGVKDDIIPSEMSEVSIMNYHNHDILS